MTFSALLERLQSVQRSGPIKAQALCPGHDDRSKRSLSARQGEDGRLLLHCFVGCPPERIVAHLGLTMADLAPPSPAPARRDGRRSITATYDYRDEAGTLLYQVVRFDPKDFRPQVPDGAGGWRYGLPETVRRVVYRLVDLPEQPRVYLVEGEKDADRLWTLGLAATTTQGGVSAWRDAYAEQLGAAGVTEVVVLPDHDAPGERYAGAVARACLARGLRVKVVRLPDLPPKGDVSDWLDRGGHPEALHALVAETPWLQTPPADGPVGAVPLATALDAWLADAAAGQSVAAVRTPFPSLNRLLVGGFAPGELIYLGARPGTGKTSLALELAREAAEDGVGVLIVSREMVTAALTRRLVAQAAHVSASNLRRGRLTETEWTLVRATLPKLRGLPVWLTDQLTTVAEIQDLVRGLAATPPLGFVVVDYLQLVRGPRAIRDRRLEVEAVSQALKALAVSRQVPVLCLSSLNRPVDGRETRPTLASLRESGELEHDADIVLLLHRVPGTDETECQVAKNRDGMTGIVRLRFVPEFVSFDVAVLAESGP